MAITAFSGPTTGLWPLGRFTIAAVGTVINLNSIVGAQTEHDSTPSHNVRGLLIDVPSGSAGNVVLMRRVQGQVVSAAGTPNFIIGTAYPGTITPLLIHGVGALINIDDYCLDADAAGAICNVTAIYG
jgi:hypothetical protein